MIKKKKAEPIKEVKELADLIHSEDETIVVLFYGDSLVLAERLYNEGYRKVSDTVKAIQDKLKASFCPDANYCGYDIHAAINEKARETLEGTK